MRKLVFALLLLCSALFATAQEWQWSVQLKGFISSETGKEPTAFLWIPSDCHQLRAVMVGKHNMSEETLFEMPRFREALSRMGIGLVWITPGIDQQWDVTKGTQEIFNRMMNDLAEVSGYSELLSVIRQWPLIRGILPLGILNGHWLSFLCMEMLPVPTCVAMAGRIWSGVGHVI